jgi:competence protein ComGC
VVVAEGGDNAAVLASLTQALRKYSVEHRRVPKSFSEVIAAGYVNKLPPAPAGKQSGIDSKTVSVILVTQ